MEALQEAFSSVVSGTGSFWVLYDTTLTSRSPAPGFLGGTEPLPAWVKSQWVRMVIILYCISGHGTLLAGEVWLVGWFAR